MLALAKRALGLKLWLALLLLVGAPMVSAQALGSGIDFFCHEMEYSDGATLPSSATILMDKTMTENYDCAERCAKNFLAKDGRSDACQAATYDTDTGLCTIYSGVPFADRVSDPDGILQVVTCNIGDLDGVRCGTMSQCRLKYSCDGSCELGCALSCCNGGRDPCTNADFE